MKTKIHPECYTIKAKCNCGVVHEIYTTRKNLHLDVCSKCHPFYTGQQKIIDASGRVDRFKKKYQMK